MLRKRGGLDFGGGKALFIYVAAREAGQWYVVRTYVFVFFRRVSRVLFGIGAALCLGPVLKVPNHAAPCLSQGARELPLVTAKCLLFCPVVF